MKNAILQQGFALCAVLASAAAWAVPTPGPVTWGSLPLFADGQISGNFDFSATGHGRVDFNVTNLAHTTRGLPTNASGHDFESHPAFLPATSGEAVTLVSASFRAPSLVNFDFSNYTGPADSLVLGLDHIAGNDSGFGGSNAFFSVPLVILSDLNGTGVLGAGGTSLDVLGTDTGGGDFILGGFTFDTALSIQLDMAARDGLRFSIGQVPVVAPPPPPPPTAIPAPGAILLVLTGLALLRKRQGA